MMQRPWLRFLMIAAWAALGLAAVSAAAAPASRWPTTVLVLIGAGAMTAVFVRWTRFSAQLKRYVRRLLGGQYDTAFGVGTEGCRDEVGTLKRLLNKLSEQLVAYDALRAERIRLLHRLADTLLQGSREPLMILDLEKESLQMGAAARALFETEQNVFSLGALRKLPENEGFGALLVRAADTEKVAVEGQVTLNLPSQDAGRELWMRLAPLKDEHNDVKRVVLFCRAP